MGGLDGVHAYALSVIMGSAFQPPQAAVFRASSFSPQVPCAFGASVLVEAHDLSLPWAPHDMVPRSHSSSDDCSTS
jgi:hypothetical protein